MISIDPVDRDSLRFLWFQDVTTEENPKLVEYRFCRLVFGLTPSRAILGATILHHLSQQEQEEVVNTLKDNLYVHDLTTGEDTVDKAFGLYQSSKSIMAHGGFNLRKWTSNSEELFTLIEKNELETPVNVNDLDQGDSPAVTEDDQSYAKSAVGTFATNSEVLAKILGVGWNTRSDTLIYDLDELQKYVSTLPATKRLILKLAAKIFDPLGILSPFVIRLKILFQELYSEGMNWDDELPCEVKQEWIALTDELPVLQNIRIPRCYFSFPSAARRLELHGFSDASKRAYAAVVYIRRVVNDQVEITMVASKSRVAPLKRQTIPRLELLGTLILAGLMHTVLIALRKIMSIDDVYCWTDSTVALYWIRNEKAWKQYVAHRVDEIRKLMSPKVWRHCPGSQNPADLPSRGMTAQQLVGSELWRNGSEFLQRDESHWPPMINDRPVTSYESTESVDSVGI